MNENLQKLIDENRILRDTLADIAILEASLVAQNKKRGEALKDIITWKGKFRSLDADLLPECIKEELDRVRNVAKNALRNEATVSEKYKGSSEFKAGQDDARWKIKFRLLREACNEDAVNGALICRLATISCGFPDDPNGES